MAEYLAGTDVQKTRAYSPAVITQGGRTVWLAGQTATRDQTGNNISGNFEAQVQTIFALIDATLKKAGGSCDPSGRLPNTFQTSATTLLSGVTPLRRCSLRAAT